jgi:hypothetical protein
MMSRANLLAVIAAMAAAVAGSRSSAEVLAAATRTQAFQSASSSEVSVPLSNSVCFPGFGCSALTELPFTTTIRNQVVRITYNAECVVFSRFGANVGLRILVDDRPALPYPISDLRPFCNSADDTGTLSTASVHQSVIAVPTPGRHVVRILGRRVGQERDWRLDDSSLVVERSFLATAARNHFFSSSQSGVLTPEIAVPLRNNGAKTVFFRTTRRNQLVKLTYNAICLVSAPRGTWVSVRILVDGKEAGPASGADFALCTALRVGLGPRSTQSGVIRQSVIRVAEPGQHAARVLARQVSSAPAAGTWHLDLPSFAVEGSLLAATSRTRNVFTGSTSEVQLPLNDNGAAALQFTTASDNRLVKITYNAECGVFGAPRGRWVNVRITVDGVEASPAAGSDFRMCASVDETGNSWIAATRQSVIRVPQAGRHVVRVFGRLTGGRGAWALDDSSLVVE